MSADGGIFLRRALALLDRLRRGLPTTARRLADAEEISVSTVQRVFHRLAADYDAPIEYDQAAHTWTLIDPSWTFPAVDLLDRGQLLSLVVAVKLGLTVTDPGLQRALRSALERLGTLLDLREPELARVLDALIVDRTDAAVLADPVVGTALDAIARGRRLVFTYDKPWADDEPRTRDVEPVQVRLSDGAAYLLATDRSRPLSVFHLAFSGAPRIGAPCTPRRIDLGTIWTDSFGVWIGDSSVSATVYIGGRHARYFARQTWHPSQVDRFEDGTLIRTIASAVSPEIVRRLLSLGDGLLWVEPEALRVVVRRAAVALAARLDLPGP